MSTIHRRAVLAGIAAAPALAAPALVLSGPDPIYAAIENHRKAEPDSLRLSQLEDDLQRDDRTPELVAAIDAAVDAAVDTRRSLAATVPTTPAGLCAYLDYLLNESVALETFFFDDDDESTAFLESLHRAVHNMNSLSAGAAS
jgi:hypothetical protein